VIWRIFTAPQFLTFLQAACISSAIWAIGGILESRDRAKFDSKLRDILMGRSQDDPLPAALNNKFDALPPGNQENLIPTDHKTHKCHKSGVTSCIFLFFQGLYVHTRVNMILHVFTLSFLSLIAIIHVNTHFFY